MVYLFPNSVIMNKQEALNNALAMIEKQFWKGSIMKLWDESAKQKVETIPSGSVWLDLALGWWYAKWRIIEIYWPESSWKTTLTLHAIAEVQKAGWVAAFIDAEHALDPEYAKKIWVDTQNLLISQPDYWEQALEIVEKLVNSWAVDLIVIDSVAALTPKAEIEGEMWDSHMWLQARLMSQALRKITGAINKTNSTVIFINQIRMKIWVMFGNPETTTGWNALKFYASQRLDIRRKWKIESWVGMDKEVSWNETTVKVIKNKIAPPFREATFDVMYNEWISKTWEILDIWSNLWIIKKSWAFYSYWDLKLGQWRENAKEFLKENVKVASEIEEVIKNSL
jgi:recombination protein RecA